MKLLGYIVIGFGIVDFVLGNFAGIDLTGVFWSPIAAGFLGSWLISLEEKAEVEIDNNENNGSE